MTDMTLTGNQGIDITILITTVIALIGFLVKLRVNYDRWLMEQLKEVVQKQNEIMDKISSIPISSMMSQIHSNENNIRMLNREFSDIKSQVSRIEQKGDSMAKSLEAMWKKMDKFLEHRQGVSNGK